MSTRTYGDVVSRITSQLNTNQLDVRIPRRFILDVFKDNCQAILSNDDIARQFFRKGNLFKWVECVKMEDIDSNLCGVPELTRCENVKVNSKELPRLLYSKFGNSIALVSNANKTVFYTKKTVIDYVNLDDRENSDLFKKNNKYYYESDGKIYIPNGPKLINIYLMSMDELADECSDCEGSSNNCTSVWDKPVSISEEFYKMALDQTVAEVMTRLQIPKDENPDLDSNVKTQTKQ